MNTHTDVHYLHHLLAHHKSVVAHSVRTIIKTPRDVQFFNCGLVENAFGKVKFGNDSGSIADGTASRQKAVKQVSKHGKENGQHRSFGNSCGRILEISREVGTSNDTSDSGEEDSKDGEEAVHLVGFIIIGVLRPKVPLKCFCTVAYKSFGLLLIVGCDESSNNKVNL